MAGSVEEEGVAVGVVICHYEPGYHFYRDAVVLLQDCGEDSGCDGVIVVVGPMYSIVQLL